MKRWRTVIHLHTNYSFDGRTTPRELARHAEEAGLDCLAVTDHDSLAGAKHVAAVSRVQVICGSEVTTRDGHLIGLFLQEDVPPHRSARETAAAIKAQGGVVLVPHPFVTVGRCGLNEAVWEILDLVDALEVCNAQNFRPSADRAAGRLARSTGIPGYVGSDSHTPDSIAPCWQLMEPFDGPGSFLESLRTAQLIPGRHPLRYFAAAGWRTLHYLRTRQFPSGFGANHPRLRATMSTAPQRVGDEG